MSTAFQKKVIADLAKNKVIAKEAVKFDAGKPPLALISRIALEEEAKVMEFGRQKYGTHNWRAGMDFSRLMDAALRHMYAFADGEDMDKETGLSHLAHARCCMAFLLEYQGVKVGTDDRFKREPCFASYSANWDGTVRTGLAPNGAAAMRHSSVNVRIAACGGTGERSI